MYFVNFSKYITKNKEQLWKEDIKYFSIWLFGFLVALLAIVALNVTFLIEFCLDKEGIVSRFYDIQMASGIYTEEHINNLKINYWYGWVINSSINTLILSLITISFVFSLVKGFKEKDFKSISLWATMFVFIEAIYGFISMLNLIFFGLKFMENFKISWANILNFVISFVYLITWFVFSRNVSIIRKIYIFVNNSERAKQQFEQMQQNSPTTTFANKNQNDYNPLMNNQTNTDVNDSNWTRINSLSDDQLKELAKKLSISGYETTSREELIKIIYQIYSSHNSTKKSTQETNVNDEDNDSSNESTSKNKLN